MSKMITKRFLEQSGLHVEYPFVYKVRGNGKPMRKLSKCVTYAGTNEIKYIIYWICHPNGKKESITEARLVYAWYKGDIPKNTDIVHIDGNVLNNSPDNLMLSPRKGRKMQL